MEKPQLKTPSKRDVMKAFGDRVLWKPEEVKPERLGLDEGVTQKNLVGENVADKYEQARITDSNTYDPHAHLSQKFLDLFEFWNRAEKPISAKLIKNGSDPITLVTGKYMEEYKHKEKGPGKNIFYSFFAFKGDLTDMNADKIKEARKDKRGEKLANFQMKVIDDDTFLLQHRIVGPQYRGPQNSGNESLGDIGLKACEQVVQSYADKEGKPKKVELDAGQIDVMLWLHKNGYTPKTDKDKERFNKVINADKSLIIVDENFVWEKNKWDERKWEPGTDVVENRHEGFEIIFEKTIKPKLKGQDTVVKDVRDKITDLA